MSYRIPKRTTKRDEYKCLKCDNCKIIKQYTHDIIVECVAENKCFVTEFSAKQFTCQFNYSVDDNTKIKKKIRKAKNEYELTEKDKKKYIQPTLFGEEIND